MLGLVAAGAALCLPYASTPRIGDGNVGVDGNRQRLRRAQSCSFLGGTVGVAAGGLVFGHAGFVGVLALVGLSALAGAALSWRLRAVQERGRVSSLAHIPDLRIPANVAERVVAFPTIAGP